MSDTTRVPMPPKRGVQMMGEDDVLARITPVRIGRRFSLDVAEEALAQMGREVLPYIAQDIAKKTVYENAHLIEAAVRSYLSDRSWCEPIVRKVLQEEIKRQVQDFLTLATIAQEAARD